MTTAAHGTQTPSVVPGVRGALVVTGALAAGSTVLALLVGGGPQVLAGLVGALMVALFFGFGSATMAVVARVVPAASLLVALLTYVLQVVLLGLVFAALHRSGATEGDLDPRWLGVVVVVGTFGWLAALLVGFVRDRRPVYDLPAPDAASHPEVGR